jgi:hypothetical protein
MMFRVLRLSAGFLSAAVLLIAPGLASAQYEERYQSTSEYEKQAPTGYEQQTREFQQQRTTTEVEPRVTTESFDESSLRQYSGEIVGVRNYALWPSGHTHSVVTIRTDMGNQLMFDFGPASELRALNLTPGSTLRVWAYPLQFGDRTVWFTQRALIDGQEFRVQKPMTSQFANWLRQSTGAVFDESRNERQLTGEVIRVRQIRTWPMGETYQTVLLETAPGDYVTVDLGPTKTLREMTLTPGESVRLYAYPMTIGERRIWFGTRVLGDDGTIAIQRPREWRQIARAVREYDRQAAPGRAYTGSVIVTEPRIVTEPAGRDVSGVLFDADDSTRAQWREHHAQEFTGRISRVHEQTVDRTGLRHLIGFLDSAQGRIRVDFGPVQYLTQRFREGQNVSIQAFPSAMGGDRIWLATRVEHGDQSFRIHNPILRGDVKELTPSPSELREEIR